MVMSPEEFALAQAVLTKLQNTTNYSYDVLIEGTRTESLMYIIAFIITIALSLLITYFAYRYISNYQKTNSYKDFSEVSLIVIVSFVFSIVVIGLTSCAFVSTALGYILPEYSVISKIMKMAISGCA